MRFRSIIDVLRSLRFWVYVGLILVAVYGLFLQSPVGFYAVATNITAIVVVVFSFGVFVGRLEIERKLFGREERGNYYVKLVESGAVKDPKDLELLFGKHSDIWAPIWIFMLTIILVEVPKDISGIQQFGPFQFYIAALVALIIVVVLLFLSVVRGLDPIRRQREDFKNYLEAKKLLTEKQKKLRSYCPE
jgi:FtsH-binding integral membrane protein